MDVARPGPPDAMLNEAVPSDGAGADMEALSLSHELLTQLAQLGAFPGNVNLDQFNGDPSATAAVLQAAGLGSADIPQQPFEPAGPSEQPGTSGDGGEGQDERTVIKRKTPLNEEERKKRRKEINRQSARRIRERKNNEMESLRQQVANLQQQQQMLLRYAAQLAREKNALVQRTLELTERLNAVAAAGNPDARLPAFDGSSGFTAAAVAPVPAALGNSADAAASDTAAVLGQPV